ncbi:hypothetical protein KIPB_013372, partial [Kipferlia bialata]|eukprot:g13372.t1
MADIDQIYCAEQISIPTELPEIIKQYTKAVIREQPKDIVSFSAKYFAKLASVRGESAQPP